MNPDWTRAPLTVRLGTSPAADQSERFPAMYAGLKRVIPPVLRRFFAFRVSGLEHLPERGPYIVAANHANYLDGVLLAMALPRKISFLVMPRVYRATPLHPYFHDHVGSIPVSLARPDPAAIRRAIRVLEQGGVVGIFPEGPFSRHGRLVRGQPGVALVALRSGVPVVPAAIEGTFDALSARRFFVPRRVPLSVRFGAPLQFAATRQRATQGVRADVTGRIMEEIAALLATGASPVPAGVPR
jgi:1-acyl-sn-glycerol-3-phosphate acyltransferase